MLKFKTPQKTPSWPHAVRLKAAWAAHLKNPKATEAQKKTAQDAYKAKVWACLREAGLVGK
jgi:hypothetical protein